MNIIEAYVKFKKQCVILISGFSGSQKTNIANFLASLCKFKLVKLSKFYKQESSFDEDSNYISTKNNLKVLSWDNIYQSVDWEEFNTYVSNNKHSGIVVVGFGFPQNMLDFEADFHIHIKIGKAKLLENRETYMKKHHADYGVSDNTSHEFEKMLSHEKMILNTITYPLYLRIMTDSKIDRFVNITEISEDEIKNVVFNYLMNSINSWLQHPPPIDHSFEQSQIKHSKPKLHQDGNDEIYDEFYYPTKKQKIYDFNDIGDEYSKEIKDAYASNDKSDTSSSSSSSDYPSGLEKIYTDETKLSPSDTDDEDSVFLFTSQQ